ncbi:MAG: hypothetical protein ACXVEF_14245 [Polyangiales bacterium]
MRTLFVFAFVSLAACSSSSESPTTSDKTDAASDTVVTALDTGSSSTETSTSEDSAPAETAADTGPEDITKSKECKDLCDAISAACPGKMCDPAFDCAVKSPHCVASTKVVLECKATTGSISCGADGFSIIHSCKYDDSVCG